MPDDTEVVKSLAGTKSLKKSGLNEKIALLERAEENYYQNKISVKQVCLDGFFFPLILQWGGSFRNRKPKPCIWSKGPLSTETSGWLDGLFLLDCDY